MGIDISRSPLFCAVDAGSMLEADALLQTVEYARAFLIARVAMSRLNVLTMKSGAFVMNFCARKKAGAK